MTADPNVIRTVEDWERAYGPLADWQRPWVAEILERRARRIQAKAQRGHAPPQVEA